MTNNFHPFHIVSVSPWPLLSSFAAMALFTSFLLIFNTSVVSLVCINLFFIVTISVLWWRDVTREATFVGSHSLIVKDGLKWGIILFILSECLFFIAWFWSFFHSSLSPTINIALQWPPLNLVVFNPFNIPLLNTGILLSSGVFVTWSHHNLLSNNGAAIALLFGIGLGLTFTFFQVLEYIEAFFTVSDTIYGATFFVITGFHGAHVVVGTLFLIFCFYRMYLNHISQLNHLGFEAALWYWHFVDVVWLFLFSFIYWWGWT